MVKKKKKFLHVANCFLLFLRFGPLYACTGCSTTFISCLCRVWDARTDFPMESLASFRSRILW